MDNLTAARPAQVLVVDDDPIVRFVHSKLLTTEGYEVTQAENGEQALALAQSKHFDVILMDINMAKMDGLEATARIRAHENSTRHVTIIGVTSFGELEHEACLAKGMDMVLGKPVAAAQLISAVQQVVEMA
jgi:CheY-like chemotaxis protein